MAFSDTVAELLTIIRNGGTAAHRFVDIRYSNLRGSIVSLLKEKGFIDQFIVDEEARKMRIFLKYTSKRKPLIQVIKRVSKPGLRKYIGYKDIPKIFGGMGVVFISTSRGVIDGENARSQQIGGEVLCYVW